MKTSCQARPKIRHQSSSLKNRLKDLPINIPPRRPIYRVSFPGIGWTRWRASWSDSVRPSRYWNKRSRQCVLRESSYTSQAGWTMMNRLQWRACAHLRAKIRKVVLLIDVTRPIVQLNLSKHDHCEGAQPPGFVSRSSMVNRNPCCGNRAN